MLTPDTPTGADCWRVLRCPNDVEIEALLNGALSHLLHSWEWDEYGDMTPDETTELFTKIYRTFREVQMPLVGSFIHTLVSLDHEFYLPCDGSNYALADWPELSPHIPLDWVSGENFTIPDMAGLSLIGIGTAGEREFEVGVPVGEFEHVLTENEMPAHSHTYTAPMISDLDFEDIGVPQPAVGINPIPQSTNNTGAGQAHNNLPPALPVKVYLVGKLP